MKTPLRSPSIVACLRQQRTHRDGSQIAQAAGDRNPRGRRLAVPLFLFFASLAAPAQADQFTAVWTGTGNWTSTANWSLNPSAPDGFAYPNNDTPAPGDSYIADINSGTATLNSGSIEVDALYMNGGNLTIDSPASLTLTSQSATSTWHSGTISGSGSLQIANGAAIKLETTNNKSLGTTIDNSGEVSFSDTGALVGEPGATWSNNADSVFDLQDDASLSRGSGTNTFINSSGAVFQKSAGSGTSTVEWRFNNSGAVVNSTITGTLKFAIGGFYGGTTVITHPGATVQLGGLGGRGGGGSGVLIGGGVVSGAGTFLISGGYFSAGRGIDEIFTINSPFELRSSDLHGLGTLEITNTFTLSGGTFRNASSFTLPNVPNSLSWSSGMLGGGASAVTTLNGTAILSSDDDKYLHRTIENNGAVAVTGRGTLIGNSDAHWKNNAGATFDLQANASLSSNQGAGSFTNSNDAILRKSRGTFSGINWDFSNTGTVRVESGFLWFIGTVNNIGSGSLAALHANPPALVGGNWEVINGSPRASRLVLGGTTVMTLGDGSTPTSVLLDRNNYQSNAEFPTIDFLNDIKGNAHLTITNGQEFSVQNSPTFTNAGRLTVGLGSTFSASSINSSGAVTGNGTINSRFGGVNLNLNGGTISPGESAGELTIQGTVTSDANSIFSFEIGGTSQADNSLGAAGVGTGHYDFLSIGGVLTLGPANPILDITLLDGFVPAAGDKFWIIDSSQPLSEIDIFAGLPYQSRVFTSDGRGSFVIHYNQDPTGANPGAVMLDGFRLLVPEPASLVLGYVAVLGLFSPRRSRL